MVGRPPDLLPLPDHPRRRVGRRRLQNSWGVDWPTPGANGIAVLTESRDPNGAASPTLTIDDASDDGQ